MKYCSYCGKQLNEGERCNCPDAQKARRARRANSGKYNKSKSAPAMNLKKLAIPAVIVLVVLIAAIALFSYAGSEIDLEEYIVIDGVEGLNGNGVLDYDLDYDALQMAMMGNTKEKEITDENFEAVMMENMQKYEEISNALECISITADKETGLSNGDKVTVTVTFENPKNYKLSYHFKEGSMTYKVSGLEDGMMVDPFDEECVTVFFAGFSGQGEAHVNVYSVEVPYMEFEYTLSQTENLTNGDTVTLTVAADSERLNEMGYLMPDTTEKVFTVSGLGEYFDIAAGFPQDELTRICDKALNLSLAQDEEWKSSGEEIAVPSALHVAFFLSAKDKTVPYEDYWNGTKFINAAVVLTNYTFAAGFGLSEREEWLVWVFPNYTRNEDGSISYNEEGEYATRVMYEDAESIRTWLAETFSVMDITELGLP